jgi:protein phosphatase
MGEKKSQDDTVEISVPQYSCGTLRPDTGSSRVEVDFGAVSHMGLVRANNEDHCLVMRFGRWFESVMTNLPAGATPTRAEEIAYGLAVADGMGGVEGGEVASRLAITTLVDLLLATPDWILGTEPEDVRRVIQRMETRWKRVQEIICERGRSEPALGLMGTTMSVAASLGKTAVVGHVGDSRVYIFRQGQLHKLTRDHTVAQSLVDLGLLAPEEAATHPRRHALTRAFGIGGPRFRADFQETTLADGDQLLLCTDGLTDMVDSSTIVSVLTQAVSADDACQKLLEAALRNGGRDNVTVALARYRIPE